MKIIIYFKKLAVELHILHAINTHVLKFSRNFVSIEDIRRRCNSMVDLSKFTSNKKIMSKAVILNYNQFCN